MTIRRSRAVAVDARRADRHVLGAPGRRREVHSAVARLVQVARLVERDRLEEDAHRAVDLRAAATQVRSIAAASSPRAGDGDHEARDVAQHARSQLSLWKWPPKPFW